MQFSLFGAAALAPQLADVEGVLVAGGHWVRSGPTARLSVVVDGRGRAEALAAAFGERGLAAEVVTADAWLAARTVFSADLSTLAEAWTRGAVEGPPPGFALTPGGLRLWAIAAGRHDGTGYLLGTPAIDTPVHRAGGAALARRGLAAVSVSRGVVGWRIISAKRLRRLAELLGPPPGELDWPA